MIRPFFLFLIACILTGTGVKAQSLSWFYGTWYGETSFSNNPVTKHIITRLQVTKVWGNQFAATMSNLYPNDTAIRLSRLIEGKIIDKNLIITSNKETYIRDSRTRNFWPDCTGCPLQSTFVIKNNSVEIAIATINCGVNCNGETIFRRDTSDLDDSQKKDLTAWLYPPVKKPQSKVWRVKEDITGIASINNIENTAKKDSFSYKKLVQTDSLQRRNKPSETIAKETPIADTAFKNDTAGLGIFLKKDTMPAALATRNTNLVKTFQITSPHITIQLYDNAEIDGDVVSVFHNGNLITDHQLLTHKAILFTINASVLDSHHEFVMVAENLGLIPPNTALMRITAGNQKFELEVSSDFDNNAKIVIDYSGE